MKHSPDKPRNNQPQAERVQPVASPCISVRKMDEARDLCIGYMRTTDEIASWSTTNDTTRLTVWKTLPKHACAWLNDAPCA